jgi:hypothetical protein
MKYKKDEKVFLALFLDNEPYENIKYKKIEMAIIPGKIRTHLGNIRESAREVSKVFLDRQKDELEAIDKLLRDVKMLSMEVNNG